MNFTKYLTGHVRVTTEEYVKREKFLPVDEIVYDSDNIIKQISKIDGVRSVRERIRFGLLLGSEDTTTESIGMGIDLKDNEFDLGKKLIHGKISDSGIYIGDKLAEKLGVGLGEELLIATKTSEGGLNGIKLKIEGIFKLRMIYDKKMFESMYPQIKGKKVILFLGRIHPKKGLDILAEAFGNYFGFDVYYHDAYI